MKVILDPLSKKCVFKIRDVLSKEITKALTWSDSIIVLCIGTDRSTGDSLGPLIGEKLRFLDRKNVYIYGNLENPIHAKNLEKTLEKIKSEYTNPYIIAIDSSLGNLQNVGKILIENIPLCPGAAMNKSLPAVGNLSIKGIVNISGFMEFMILQNTRLFTVMTLADAISRGIYHSIIKVFGGKHYSYGNKKDI